MMSKTEFGGDVAIRMKGNKIYAVHAVSVGRPWLLGSRHLRAERSLRITWDNPGREGLCCVPLS